MKNTANKFDADLYDFTPEELAKAKDGSIYYLTFKGNPGKTFCASLISSLFLVALDRPGFKITRKECDKLAADIAIRPRLCLDPEKRQQIRAIARDGNIGPILNSDIGCNLWGILELLRSRNFWVSLVYNGEEIFDLTPGSNFQQFVHRLDILVRQCIGNHGNGNLRDTVIDKYRAKKETQLGNNSDPIVQLLMLLSKFALNYKIRIIDKDNPQNTQIIHLNLLRIQSKAKP